MGPRMFDLPNVLEVSVLREIRQIAVLLKYKTWSCKDLVFANVSRKN